MTSAAFRWLQGLDEQKEKLFIPSKGAVDTTLVYIAALPMLNFDVSLNVEMLKTHRAQFTFNTI